MTDVATVDTTPPPPEVVTGPLTRRFQAPDLSEHGAWIMGRFLKAYPHVPERNAAGWLNGLIFNNECLFLYQPNAVGLAQVERAHTLSPHPIVREHFLFARDKRFVEEASWMYTEFERWARQLGADTLVVSEGLSDVPVEMVAKRLGGRRIYTRTQRFLKVAEKG